MKHLHLTLACLFFLFTTSIFAASPNELFDDGGFDSPNIKPNPDTEQGVILEGENRVMQLIKHSHSYEWTPPVGPIWGAEYILRFRIKGNDTAGSRLCLWNRLPDQHEPPEGPIFSQFRTGTFDWTTEEVRFKMPSSGVNRFILFLDHRNSKGWCRVDDISIRPADDAAPQIAESQKHIGLQDREQTCWIWANNDYPWTPAGNHNQEFAKPASKEERILFRRTFTLPSGASNVQAIFCGDDQAILSIDGKTVGQNQNLQDVAKIPLTLASGKHELQFAAENKFGPGGLAARIEWTDAAGKRSLIATNDRWECSHDTGANEAGKTWKPATVMTVVTPAATQFHWLYPHLEKLSYRLNYTLPTGAVRPRLAVRSTGGFAAYGDGKLITEGTSAGKVLKMELSKDAVKNVTVELSDISQPPRGQGMLQYMLNGKAVDVPLEEFKTETGTAPASGSASGMTFYPGRGMPHNIATFDAAASLPAPSFEHAYQDWQKALLKNAVPIWTLGMTDNSSQEFAEFVANKPKTAAITLPLQNTKSCPRGLELRWQPELTLAFNLTAVPQNGAAFELNVEDTDAMVTQIAVFVNGLFVGMPQIIGYDQVPGGRTTNRSWFVTVPANRFVSGKNTLTLRVVPSSYTKKGETVNQSDEYIKLMNLRNRNENPYPTSDWLHWDRLALHALPQEVSEPINGRPAYMGTNLGYLALSGFKPFEEYILRDLEYFGMKQSQSPIRLGIWNKGQYDQVTPAALDQQLDALNKRGLKPFFLFEPGRQCNNWDDFEKSNEVELMKKHGSKIAAIEIGNEVDHPGYGFDQMAMSVAYATIQKQSVMGQALKKYANNPNLKVTGEGWYHAWNYGVIDAQARKESANDPGFTDHLAAHDYGRSYIQPALTYYSLYGANMGDPKPIWVTECGSWTPNDENVFEFDVNLRGNLSYVTYIAQYLLYPYDNEMRQFSMLSEQGAGAKILEKARIYRRLIHAYALHGKPIAYRIMNESAMKDQLVCVNPVLVEGGAKLAFVNFSDKPQKIEVELKLPKSGSLSGKRYGAGETVSAGTKPVTLKASPNVIMAESLAPRETLLYDLTW